MSLNYETTNWENGKTVLRAEHLRKIEKGITDIISENDAIYKDEDIRKSNEKQRQEEHSRKMNEVSEVVSDIQKDYDSLQKIIIDENASANLQNQINQTNSQLEHNTNDIYNLDKLKMKYIYKAKALGGDIDDDVAIVNALENDDIVFLPCGTYIINQSIYVKSNKTIIGEQGTKIYYNQPDKDNSHILVLGSNNITIDNITLEGNTTYHKNSFGILINDVHPTSKINNITIKNCSVKNTSSAGIVAREVKNITVENCNVEYTNRDGIQLTGCENFLITNCKTYNTGDDGIASHAGYTDGYCYGSIINNIVKNSNIARGITTAGGEDIIISNNLIDGFGQTGVMCLYDENSGDGKQSPQNINITNNIIINRTEDENYLGGTCGIYLYQPEIVESYLSNINICGNNIYNKTNSKLAYGVRFMGCVSDVNISNNNIIDTKQAFNFGSKTKNILINGNKIKCDILLNCWGDAVTENGVAISNNKVQGTNNKLLSVNGLVRLIANDNEFTDFPLECDVSSLKSNIYDNIFINTLQLGVRGFIYDNTTKTFTPFN